MGLGALVDREILGATQHGAGIEVLTATGMHYLSYARAELALDTGRPLSVDELRQVCVRYWAEFGRGP